MKHPYHSKKGASLPLNTIIIAVMALIVLAVILVIFSDRIGTFGETTRSCSSLGGQCADSCSHNQALVQGMDCQGKVCCKEAFPEP